MTAPGCATGCGQPSPNAVICGGCAGELTRALQLAASIAPDLDDAIARQLRHGGGGKAMAAEPPLPVDLHAADVAENLRAALAACAADVALRLNVMGIEPLNGDRRVLILARWLTMHIADVAQLPDAGGHHAAITAAVIRAAAVLDPPPDRVYSGPCTRCGADLLSAPGVPVVTCMACGQNHEVREQQAAMGEALCDMLGTVQWCATAAAAVGVTIPEGTIYSWAGRAQLVPRGSRPSLRGSATVPLYRLGDVIDLAARGPRGDRITSM